MFWNLDNDIIVSRRQTQERTVCPMRKPAVRGAMKKRLMCLLTCLYSAGAGKCIYRIDRKGEKSKNTRTLICYVYSTHEDRERENLREPSLPAGLLAVDFTTRFLSLLPHPRLHRTLPSPSPTPTVLNSSSR